MIDRDPRATTIQIEAAREKAHRSTTMAELPWLVCEDGQRSVNGYVYASKHRERPAYQWSVEVTAYVGEDASGTGVGKRLYQVLFAELASLGYFQAFAGIAPCQFFLQIARWLTRLDNSSALSLRSL